MLSCVKRKTHAYPRKSTGIFWKPRVDTYKHHTQTTSSAHQIDSSRVAHTRAARVAAALRPAAAFEAAARLPLVALALERLVLVLVLVLYSMYMTSGRVVGGS